MDKKKQIISLDDARQIDMVDYLLSLGFQPSKIRNNDYWYSSPLRDENTPSFKVNRKLNCWYDHGIGNGGNFIDFAILYHHCSVHEFLEKLKNNSSFHQSHIGGFNHPEERKESKILIVDQREISSLSLQRYLLERRILPDVAREFCKQVTYRVNDKEYYSIGFKNDAGGYELRNSFYKCSSSPKDVTSFNNGSIEATIFEGFFDFLSFISIHKNSQPIVTDFVVLNSLSFFEKARPFMEQHKAINLYLDRDTTGQNYTRYALSLSSKYKDESHLYKHYKDLNDWAMNIGKGQRKSFRPKL